MTGDEAGWYRDPAPPQPSAPSTLRYWDGKGWTTQVKAAPKKVRQAWQAEIAEQQRAWAVQQMQQMQQMQTATYDAPATMVVETSRDFTPDGERLAGWWSRVGASMIDGVITGVLGILFAWRFVRQLVDVSTGAVTDLEEASAAGSAPPDSSVYVHDFVMAYLGILVVMVLVRFVYDVGFLKGFQATPGKMALGLEVRLRERPGVLPWGTVLLRWLAQRGYGLLAFVPVLGGLVVLAYGLLDPLWPTWDGNRQALHDKVAKTNVVTRRR